MKRTSYSRFLARAAVTLLAVCCAPWAANAYNAQVQVGTGTSESYNAPINLYYNYSYSQQIYTAAQINGDCSLPGEIESISFYYVGSVEKTAPITVFMKTTDKTSFSSTSDWETVTADDIVFDGDWTVTANAGWVTITFTEPFAYDGQSNLVIAINKGYYSTYSSSTKFRYTTTTNNQLLYKQNDGGAYDPYTPPTGSTSQNLPNILFNMTIDHPAPSALTLDEVVINTATISWTAPQTTNTITGYAYEYTDGETTETGTSTGTIANLTGLTAATDYLFQVKAIYSDGESCLSEALDFTTLEACMTPENLTISDVTAHSATLNWTEGYGDGQWVLQYKLSTEEEYTNSVNVALSDLPYTLTGLTAESTYDVQISPVCDDTKTITGNFTTTIACPAPNGLDATLTPGDGTVATFSWTENGSATAWQLCINGDEDNLIDMDENPFTYNGFTPEETYTAKVRAVCGGIDGESAWSNTVTFTPTDAYMLTVNDGTTTNSYVPVYGMWIDSYTKCQFIIPASELQAMQYGNINKMTFYSSSQNKTWGAAEFDVLLTEVDNATFENATLVDWESMDQVYHGAVSVSDYKMEIVFDNDYQYMGGNLLVGFHQTVKGTYSSITWYGITSQNSAIGGYESDAKGLSLQSFLPKTTFAYEPGEAPTCDRPEGLAVVGDPEAHSVVLEWTETGGASAWQLCLNGDEDNLIDVDENPYTLTGIDADTDFTVKVRASCSDTDHSPWSSGISFHTPETCPKPTNLVVTYNGGNTAEVSWDSESTDFNIDVNGTVTAITENPYTLTNLELATTYTVKVQANCGGGEVSAWVTADPFTTDQCMPEDMCAINITLTDSYGDGWNGGKLDVVDALTDDVLETYTLTNGSSESFTLAVCNGRVINFVYTAGSYGTENGWVITDINEEVIANHEGCNSGCAVENGIIATHTVNCPSCIKPNNLTATNVSTTSATLSWTGYNDSYVLQYRPWHQVGEDQIATEEFVTYTYDLSEFSGTGSIAIRHYDVSDVFYLNVDNIELTDADGDVIVSEDFESGAIPSTWTNYDVDGDGYTWELAETGSMNVIDDYGIYSASWISNVGALNPDNWLIIPNVELGGTLSFAARGQDPNYPSENFAVYVSTESSLTEVELEDPTYTADNLEPSTPYTWQVKGLCGTDEESRWSSSMFKTTDDVLVFATDGYWNEVSNWTDAEGNAITELPTIENKVRIDAAATIPAGVVAKAGKTTINGGSITIMDGGQLKHKAATLKVTLNKNITGYGEGTGNYKLISSPFTGTTQIGYNGSGWSYVDITGDGYDLYGFASTEDNEWINNESSSQHAVFTSGSNYGLRYLDGYLYANEEDITLDFTGTAPSSVISTHSVDVTYDDTSTDMFNGWKLVGNPFTCNAYLMFGDENGDLINATFYKMNTAGNGYDKYENYVMLAPGEGAFINYNATGKIYYFSDDQGWTIASSGTTINPLLPAHGLTTDQDANVVLTLANDDSQMEASQKNSAIIAANDGKFANVTLAGRTLYKDGDWNTLCLPFDVTLANSPLAGNVTAKELTDANVVGDKVTLTFGPAGETEPITELIAGTPYIIKWDNDGSDDIVNPVFTGVTIDNSPEKIIDPQNDGSVQFKGNYSSFEVDNNIIYYMAAGNDNYDGILQRAKDSRVMKPFRAYFQFSDEIVNSARQFVLDFGESEVMGISNIPNTSSTGEGSWYTVDGKKLDKQPTRKGVYIQNGQKVVIK